MYIILINNKLRIDIAEIETEKEVQDLINNRSDLDYLLQIAMSQKNKFLVKALIEKGANVNYYGNLSYVIEEIRCPQILKLLIDRGANVNEEYPDSDGFGVTYPLDCAILDPSTQQLKILLDNGAKVNPPKTLVFGHSTLHFAVLKHHFEAVDLLLQYGANVHALNDCHETPLHTATATQNKLHCAQITKLLLEYDSSPHKKDVDGNNPVENTFKFDKIHMLKTILKHYHE